MAKEVIGNLQVRLSAATAEFNRNLGAARKRLAGLKRAGESFATGGAALAGFAGIVAGVGRAAGRASRDLNAGMANVATLIPGATNRVGELKTAVQDLAVPHGKESADLAGGLYQTISAFGDEAGRSMEILRIGSMAASAGAATTGAVGLRFA